MLSGLAWSVMSRFIDYIRAMGDGVIELTDGASELDGRFMFPLGAFDREAGGEVYRFRGGVRFSGHYGMLDLRVEDPWIRLMDGGAVLSIRDVDSDDGRLELARGSASVESEWIDVALSLTAEGSELFFGRYARGQSLDVATITVDPNRR